MKKEHSFECSSLNPGDGPMSEQRERHNEICGKRKAFCEFSSKIHCRLQPSIVIGKANGVLRTAALFFYLIFPFTSLSFFSPTLDILDSKKKNSEMSSFY